MLIGMVGAPRLGGAVDAILSAGRDRGERNYGQDYPQSRIEVIAGRVVTSVAAFFIIVACAGAIWLKPFGN
jgi:hypothetical protein